MARGDGGKRIFVGKEDCQSFLHGLERVCQSHGWRVHAWVLMGNHFHLLLEAPDLGEEGFKDKLLGLIDTASAKLTKQGSVAEAAIRAHGEGEAERIIRVIGAELGLPDTTEELRALRKGDPGKVICAALVKANTSVTNEWLTARLCMWHPAAMCQLVSRARKDPKIQKILKKQEKTFRFKD
jgi:hypothetical protein